jgi:hypothetical protein
LIKWYNSFKPKHPNFELVFFSDDFDENAMLKYMSHDAMPWPAIKFSELPEHPLLSFFGGLMPYLVLVDLKTNQRILPSDDLLKQKKGEVRPELIWPEIEKVISKKPRRS